MAPPTFVPPLGSCAHLWFLQKDGALMQTLWMMPPEKLQGILHAAETILQTAKRKRVMLFRALGKTLKCHIYIYTSHMYINKCLSFL